MSCLHTYHRSLPVKTFAYFRYVKFHVKTVENPSVADQWSPCYPNRVAFRSMLLSANSADLGAKNPFPTQYNAYTYTYLYIHTIYQYQKNMHTLNFCTPTSNIFQYPAEWHSYSPHPQPAQRFASGGTAGPLATAAPCHMNSAGRSSWRHPPADPAAVT